MKKEKRSNKTHIFIADGLTPKELKKLTKKIHKASCEKDYAIVLNYPLEHIVFNW